MEVTAEAIKDRGYNLDLKNPHVVVDEHGDPEQLLAQLEVLEAATAALQTRLRTSLENAILS